MNSNGGIDSGQAVGPQLPVQASVPQTVQTSFSSGVKYTYQCKVAPTKTVKVMGVEMGTSGHEITLTGEDGRAVKMFARALDDLKPGEIRAKADGIELVEAGSKASESNERYVPIQLKDQEGEMRILLVRMDRAKGVLETYSQGTDIPYGDNFPPLAVVDFLAKNKPDDSKVKEVIQNPQGAKAGKGKKKQVQFSPSESGSSSSSTGEAQASVGRAIKELHDDAVYFTSQALKITAAESEKIKGVVGRFHNLSDEQWDLYKKRINVKPGFKNAPHAAGSPDVIHIRAGDPFIAIPNGEICISPYSLLITRGKSGEVNVEILLKGKVPGFSDPSRPHGSFKSIKTTFDLTTGRIRVQCTIDIGAQARRKANFRGANGKMLTKAEIEQDPAKLGVVRELENVLVAENLRELAMMEKYTSLEISKQTSYLAKPTRPEMVQQRRLEGKAIREEYDLILTYTATKAEGDLDNPDCFDAVRGELGVNTISQSLYDCLEGTAKVVAALHEDGIAHRDIKPGNLLLMKSKEGLKTEITDFGLALAIDRNSGKALESKPISGSFSILPPELVVLLFVELIPELDSKLTASEIEKRKELVDFRKVDVYGLGCTFYQILTSDKAQPNPDRRIVPYAKAGGFTFGQAIQYQRFVYTLLPKDREERLSDLKKSYLEIKETESDKWREARSGLRIAEVPQALLDLVMDMLHPDPNIRCDMSRVFEGIKNLESIVKK